MAFERLAKELRHLLPNHQIQTPLAARSTLEDVYQSRRTFPQEHQTRIMQIITKMSVLDMQKKEHRGKPKRDDRTHGQALRKKRTGSRRG